MDGPFEYLVPKFVEISTENFLKDFQKNQKYYRIKIKQDLIESPVCKFRVSMMFVNNTHDSSNIEICATLGSKIR